MSSITNAVKTTGDRQHFIFGMNVVIPTNNKTFVIKCSKKGVVDNL
ncbi:MAG: hypothetical protein ACFWUE_09630 [Xylanivirga thermophila]|jgi:hypothetical protein